MNQVNNMPKQYTKEDIVNIIKDTVSNIYSSRFLADSPTDSLQLTPRKYVNLSGTIPQRPASVIASKGQQYFATDLNKPIFFDGTKWRDATSSVVASN